MGTQDRTTIGLSFAAMAQHGVILLLVGPMVPNIMSTFGIGESLAGLLLGMGSVGFIMGPVFAGVLADRINVRAALLAGFLIEIGVLVLFGVAPAFFVAVISNLLLHLGGSFVETGVNIMPTLVTTRRSPHGLMNLVHMFFSIGAFLGPLLIGLYIDATGAWRPILFFTLVPTGILFLVTLRSRFPRRSGREARSETILQNLLPVAAMPHVLFGALTLLLYVGAEVGVSSWVVYYLQTELELSPALSGAGLSVLWVFVMIGRYLNAQLGERFSSRTLVIISGLSGSVAVLIFVLVNAAPLAFLVLAWIGISFAGVFPHVMGELNNRVPGRAGTVTAVMAMGASTGAALFQWLVGYMAEHLSVRVAFLIPALLQFLLIGSFLIALRAADRLALS
jgi:fucose permease